MSSLIPIIDRSNLGMFRLSSETFDLEFESDLANSVDSGIIMICWRVRFSQSGAAGPVGARHGVLPVPNARG